MNIGLYGFRKSSKVFKMGFLFTLLSALIIVGFGCLDGKSVEDDKVTNPGSNWWKYNVDLANTGYFAGNNISVPLELSWEKDLESTDTSRNHMFPPVFGNNKILVACGINPGSLFAISTRDGSALWSFTARSDESERISPRGAPVVANGHVYGAFEVRATGGGSPSSGRVYSLSEADGSITWETSIPHFPSGSITVAHGLVFVVSWNGKVHALNQADGSIAWNTDAMSTEISFSSPAISTNKIIFTNPKSAVALNVSTGIEAWRLEFGDQMFNQSPMIYTNVDEPVVLFYGVLEDDVPNTDSTHNDTVRIYALSYHNGALKWSSDISTDFTNNNCFMVANNDGNVFLLAGTHLVSLDAATGSQNWTQRLESRIEFAPAVTNGIIYYTDGFTIDTDTAYIYGRRTSDGSLVWKNPLPETFQSSVHGIAIDQGLVVVPQNGKVLAFSPSH